MYGKTRYSTRLKRKAAAKRCKEKVDVIVIDLTDPVDDTSKVEETEVKYSTDDKVETPDIEVEETEAPVDDTAVETKETEAPVENPVVEDITRTDPVVVEDTTETVTKPKRKRRKRRPAQTVAADKATEDPGDK
jgi:hypothetical protein